MEKASRKKIAVCTTLLQALMWIPIITLMFLFQKEPSVAPILLIMVYSLLILFGTFYGPAWASWMKDIVPKKGGKYFGTRNRICGFVALISMLIAGFILDYFKKTKLFIGFAILFAIAFIARSISAFLFTKKYEPELKPAKEYYFSFKQFLKKLPQNNFGRFTIFVAVMGFAVATASPFFAVYMLKDLSFSYTFWITVVISSAVTNLLFMPIWGRFADRYGNLRTIKITGIVIPIIPLLWLAAPLFNSTGSVFAYLIAVEGLSGCVWAGFNLASSNFIYDAVTRQRMVICTAYSNVLNGLGVFIGATIGGIIASQNFKIIGLSSILFIFLLSGLLRLIVFALWIPKIKEVREVEKFDMNDIRKKIRSLRPEQLLEYFELSNPKDI
jgi:MFS family permease